MGLLSQEELEPSDFLLADEVTGLSGSVCEMSAQKQTTDSRAWWEREQGRKGGIGHLAGFEGVNEEGERTIQSLSLVSLRQLAKLSMCSCYGEDSALS